MATTKKQSDREPVLFVKLSDPAAAALKEICAKKLWNKKTATEMALIEFAKGAGK